MQKTISLNQTEVNHLLQLILENDETGSYFGVKKHYRKRSDTLKKKISALITKPSEIFES